MFRNILLSFVSFVFFTFIASVGVNAQGTPPFLYNSHPADYWTEMNEGITGWNISGIAIDHVNPNIVYILTMSLGIFKSEDGGLSWIEKNNGLPEDKLAGRGNLPRGNTLAMDPADSSNMYMAVDGKAYRTLDGAENWEEINEGIDDCSSQNKGYQLEGILVDPSNPDHIFAAHTASGNCGGIYESFNQGTDWGPRIDNVGTGDAWVLTIDPSNSQNLYMAPAYLGFLYSTDGGHNWTQSRPPGSGDHGTTTVVHPTITNRVFAGFPEGLYRSDHYGHHTWIDMTTSVSDEVTNIKFSPSNSAIGYLVGEGGLLTTTDSGENWTEVGNYGYLGLRTIDIFAGDPYTIYLGSIGSGVFKSTNGGVDIVPCIANLPESITVYVVAIAPSDSNIYYASVFLRGFYRSDDRGENWSLVSTDPGITETYAISISNNDPDTLFAGFEKIYRSTDGGHTWTISLDSGYDEAIKVIQTDPTDDNIKFASSDRQAFANLAAIFRTTDGGESWQIVHSIRTKEPRPIIFDPSDTNTIYIGIGAYDGNPPYAQGVLKSEMGGEPGSWNLLYGGLDAFGYLSRTVRGLAINKFRPSELYLGSRDSYFYESTNYGEDWSPFARICCFPNWEDLFTGKILQDEIDPDRIYVTSSLNWYSRDIEYHWRRMPLDGIMSTWPELNRSIIQDTDDPNRFIAGDKANGVLMFNKYKDYEIYTNFPEKLQFGDTLDISGTIQHPDYRDMLDFDGTVEITITEEGAPLIYDKVEALDGCYTKTYTIDQQTFGGIGRKDLVIYATDHVVDASIVTQFSIVDIADPHTPPIITGINAPEVRSWGVDYTAQVDWDDDEQDMARILVCDTDVIAGLSCLRTTYCESEYQVWDSNAANRVVECSFKTRDDTGTRHHTDYIFLCDEFECSDPETMQYSLNYKPDALMDVPDFNLIDHTDEKTIDLNECFFDKDGDELTFNSVIDIENATVDIVGNLATISLAEGSPRARARFLAFDPYQDYTFSNSWHVNFIPENRGVEIAYDNVMNLVIAGFNYFDDNTDPETNDSIKDFYKNDEFLVSRSEISQTALIHFDGNPNTTEGWEPEREYGTLSYIEGKYGQAIHFGTEGWVNYYAEYGQETFWNVETATIEFWVKRDDNWDTVNEDTWIIYDGLFDNGLDLLWDSETKLLTFIIWNYLTNETHSIVIDSDTTGWLANEWHHISVEWKVDGSESENFIKMHADEFCVEQVGGISPFDFPPLAAGKFDLLSLGHKHYALDEIRISNTPLSQVDPIILSYSSVRDTAFMEKEVLLDNNYFSVGDTISVQYCPSDGISMGDCDIISTLVYDDTLTGLVHFDGDANTAEGWEPEREYGTLSYIEGKYGQAIHFGTEGWVNYYTEYGQETFWNLETATIEFWVKRDENWDIVNEDTWIIYDCLAYNGFDLLWDSETKLLTFIIFNYLEYETHSIAIDTDTTEWLANEWHHISVEWKVDGSESENFIKMHADEFCVEQIGGISPFYFPPLLPGVYDVISLGHKKYALDELRIWNVPRSSVN